MQTIDQDMDFYTEIMKAEHALDVRRYDLAIEMMLNLLKQAPEASEPYIIISRAYSMQDQYETAIQALRQALSIDPNNENAHAFLGYLLGKLKKGHEADDAFQTALRLNPESAVTHYWYGNFLGNQHYSTDKALFHAQKALEIDSLDPNHHVLYGFLLAEKGELKKAEYHLKEAFRIDPSSYLTHYNYGLFLLYHKNEPLEAFNHLKEAIRMNPEDQDLREAFLLALKAKNRFYSLFWTSSLWFRQRGDLLILGLILLFIITGLLTESNPTLGLAILVPILCIYFLGCILAWTINPLFNFFIKKNWIQ